MNGWIARRQNLLTGFGVAALLLVSLYVRLRDFQTLYPYFIYQDELRHAQMSLRLLRERTLKPEFYLYPHFPVYATALAYGGYFLARDGREVLAQRSLAPVFESARKFDETSWTCLKIERSVSLFFGLLAVLAFFRLSRSLLGNGFGLVAAFFFSLFPLCVSFSQLAKVDMDMVCFIVISWIFQINIIRRGRMRDYILTGIFAGLIFDCKVNAISMYSMLYVFLLRARIEGAKTLKAILDRRVFALVLATVWSAFLFSPFYFTDLSRALENVGWMYFSSTWAPYFHFDPRHFWLDKYYYALMVLLPSMVGGPVFILALLAAAQRVLKMVFDEWFLLVYISFSFAYTFYSSASSYYYYLSFSALPFLALLAAGFLQWGWQKFPRPGKALVAVVTALVLIGGFGRSRFYQQMNFSAYDRAGPYLAQNLPAGSRVMGFTVHLPGTGLERISFTEAWPQDLSREMVKKENPDYILIDRWNFAGFEKIYREQLPIAGYLKELLEGQWGYRIVKRFGVRYPGDYFYERLDPEFRVELDLLERVEK